MSGGRLKAEDSAEAQGLFNYHRPGLKTAVLAQGGEPQVRRRGTHSPKLASTTARSQSSYLEHVIEPSWALSAAGMTMWPHCVCQHLRRQTSGNMSWA